MSSRPDQQEAAPDDWLEGCIGFVAESHHRRVGRVAEVQHDADSGRAVALVLRAGMAGRRRLFVPVDEVAGVLPSSDRIILDDSGRADATDQELSAELHGIPP